MVINYTMKIADLRKQLSFLMHEILDIRIKLNHFLSSQEVLANCTPNTLFQDQYDELIAFNNDYITYYKESLLAINEKKKDIELKIKKLEKQYNV